MNFKSIALFLVVYSVLVCVQCYDRNNHGELDSSKQDLNAKSRIINDITIDLNKQFLNSINTSLLNEMVVYLNDLIFRINSHVYNKTESGQLGDVFKKNISKKILKLVQVAHDLDKTLPNTSHTLNSSLVK